MRVDPRIGGLRRDPAPQQRAQAAMIAACDAWRGEARVAPVLADLAAYGQGDALAGCPALAALFASGGEATRFAAGFCARFANKLADEPLGQLPFRQAHDGTLSTLLLARSGRAQLTLTAQEPGEYSATSVLFSDAERRDAVIAGSAEARLTSRGTDGALAHEDAALATGSRLALDLSREALFVSRVERRLATLRLSRTAANPGPVREHDLASGDLLYQAAGTLGHSRQELMIALLGRMKRREAAPAIAAVAAGSGPDALRWEALREALALDTARGFAALSELARSPGDPLAPPAAALRTQLVEAHPQLLALEDMPCRA
jgi:hypothetical protein